MAVVLKLHLLVFKAETAHEFNAPDLHPDEEIGVINDTHLVGFGVADAQMNILGPVRAAGTQCPLQCGLRFSRNAVIPSRKSSVCRIRAFCSMAASRRLSNSSLTVSDSNCFVARNEAALLSISERASS